MQFKKVISVWAILALAFAQLAIAQHSAVHSGHSFEVAETQYHANAHHKHDDKDLPSKHECPECLLVKSLQTAFHADGALHIDFTLYEKAFPISETLNLSQTTTSAYNPRAPPILLI